jgi:hypothetical protein
LPNKIFNIIKLALGAFFALIFLFVFSPSAQATVYNVTPTSACSLNDAIIAAGNPAGYSSCPAGGASNTINVGAGEYFIIGSLPDIDYDGDLSIVGENPTTTILDGNASNAGLRFDPPSDNNNYSISNLTFRNFVALVSGPSDYRTALASYKGNMNVNNIIVRNNQCSNPNIPICLLFGNTGNGDTVFNLTNSSFYYNFGAFLVAVGTLSPGNSGDVTLNMINNTISNNNSAVIDVTNVSSGSTVVANLINNTIANNSVIGFPGILVLNVNDETITTYPVTLNLKNNIFYANNVDVGGGTCPITLMPGDTITSQGGNLSSDSSCLAYFIGSDKSNIDPLLNVLTLDNGTYVRPLAANSAAIGSAISSGSPSTDQRGVTRPQGGAYDSGSYEYNGPGVPSGVTPYPPAGYLVGTGRDLRWILIASAFLIASGSVFAYKSFHHSRQNKKTHQNS